MGDPNRPRTRAARALVILVSIVPSALASEGGPDEKYGKIELLRDRWGIPHVFSDTDAGALYGLGWAAAEDRGFQMYYSLRIIQGRLAELLGDVKKTRRSDTAVENDRKMRTFGFDRAAKRVAGNLDPGTIALLEAYSQGVNDYFAGHRKERHYLFERLGLDPEPWTPAACIVSWWHLAQFFGTDGTRDLMAYRRAASGDTPGGQRGGRGGRAPGVRPGIPRPPAPDDAAAVVRKDDVPESWVRDVLRFAAEHGIAVKPEGAAAGPNPKFSHAWVVGGRRTTTGSAVLVSDPQTPVTNPSLFHEFHVSGKTLDARGIGVPGSPVILIGWNRDVAWGMTALGADQADLFRLKTDPSRPEEYLFDGKWRRLEVTREEIRVRGGESRTLEIRHSHLGPLVTEFCFPQAGDPPVAVKRIPIAESDRETIQGALAMMRSRDCREFLRALGGWRFPSANVVFGDRRGSVGYSVAGAIPIRSRHAAEAGRFAHDGTASKFDWQGIVPGNLLPRVIDPARGFILSGNHRPIQSFYPIPLGTVTGSLGDTLRSWRLRERLSVKEKLTPRGVLDVHHDTVNPALREIVRLGYHLRDVLKRQLSEDALATLKHLEPWYKASASADLGSPGSALAAAIDTNFRHVNTELAAIHGGGQSGLARFLKGVAVRLEKDRAAALEPLEEEFIDRALAAAWRRTGDRHGSDPARWDERAREEVTRGTLGYFDSLDGFGSLDAEADLSVPALTCVDGNTIQSQRSQAYTQWVPLHDVDAALSILPIGSSERPGSPHRLSTYRDWERGVLHPAPLSRQKVERHTVSRQLLSTRRVGSLPADRMPTLRFDMGPAPLEKGFVRVGAEKNHCLFSLMLAIGIRLSSARNLDVDDVDPGRGEIRLRSTKGDRPATVYPGQ